MNGSSTLGGWEPSIRWLQVLDWLVRSPPAYFSMLAIWTEGVIVKCLGMVEWTCKPQSSAGHGVTIPRIFFYYRGNLVLLWHRGDSGKQRPMMPRQHCVHFIMYAHHYIHTILLTLQTLQTSGCTYFTHRRQRTCHVWVFWVDVASCWNM